MKNLMVIKNIAFNTVYIDWNIKRNNIEGF